MTITRHVTPDMLRGDLTASTSTATLHTTLSLVGGNTGQSGSNSSHHRAHGLQDRTMKLLVGFVCCFLFSETVTFRFLQPSHYSTKLRRIETIVHLVEEEIIVPFHPPVLWQFYSFVKMAAFKERLRVENTLGCSRRPSRAVGKYLGRICEDCFNIYKDYDIFEMCR